MVWASRWSVAHSIGKFFLCYIILFSSETSAPGSPGNYLYLLTIHWYHLSIFFTRFAVCHTFSWVFFCAQGWNRTPFVTGLAKGNAGSLNQQLAAQLLNQSTATCGESIPSQALNLQVLNLVALDISWSYGLSLSIYRP